MGKKRGTLGERKEEGILLSNSPYPHSLLHSTLLYQTTARRRRPGERRGKGKDEEADGELNWLIPSSFVSHQLSNL